MSQFLIICPKCNRQVIMHYTLNLTPHHHRPITIKGVLRCNQNDCGHERPITLDGESIEEIMKEIPGQQSDSLNPSIADDIKEDIEEAERANYNQCYKASVVMCRRALQLGLMDSGIKDKPLGKMLMTAFNKKYIDRDTYNLARTIKHFGDIGVHRREPLEPNKIGFIIQMTVDMLNKLPHETKQ